MLPGAHCRPLLTEADREDMTGPPAPPPAHRKTAMNGAQLPVMQLGNRVMAKRSDDRANGPRSIMKWVPRSIGFERRLLVSPNLPQHVSQWKQSFRKWSHFCCVAKIYRDFG